MKEKIKRYNPDIRRGLTSKEVEERFTNNLVNFNTDVKTKSEKMYLLYLISLILS